MKEQILDILEDITGTDEIRENLDIDLFEEGLLDSMGAVQLLVELEAQCDLTVPVSEFVREEWATPNLIIEKASN